jgi:hypothetical protein
MQAPSYKFICAREGTKFSFKFERPTYIIAVTYIKVHQHFLMVKIHLGIKIWQVSASCMRLLSEDSEDVNISSVRPIGIMAFKIK